MRDDSLENDPRTLWQNQPTEPSVMTLEKIRQKVRELRAKTRRQLLGSLMVPLIVVAFYGFAIIRFHSPVLRPLFALVIAWSLGGVYFLNRGMWSAAMPGDAALSTGLVFYRREVERRCNLFRRLLWCSFLPIVLVIGAFILALARVGGKSIFPNATPFITLVVVWIAAYSVIRMREQRKLQREIGALNDIERENR
jgi:hypothetical protein